MASGCIVGDCPVCDYPVFEDEWSGIAFVRYDKFIHIGSCQQAYERTFQRTMKIRQLEKEKEKLNEENIKLKKQIETGQMFFNI